MGRSWKPGPSNRLGLAVAGVLALVGAGLGWLHQAGERRTPAGVLKLYVSALRAAQPAQAAPLVTAGVHDELMRSLCSPRYGRAKHVYDEVIPALATPAWTDIRRRAEGIAMVEAIRLRAAIDEQGRLAVGREPADKLAVLLNRPAMYEEFVACKGHEALPKDDREKIRDPLRFYRAAARLTAWTGAAPLGEHFIVAASWPQLPGTDRGILGTPEALALESSAAKLACFDRIAMPLLGPRYVDVPGDPGRVFEGDWTLTNCAVVHVTPDPVAPRAPTREQASPDWRPHVEGITRDDVADLATFMARHGEATASGVLASCALSAPPRFSEDYPRLKAGSLLRQGEARASGRVGVRDAPVEVRTRHLREDAPWQITHVAPAFTLALAEGE